MNKKISALRVFLLATLLLSTSCTMPESLGYKRMFLYGVPKGNDSFSQGWRDGCDTSLAIVGEGSLRLIKEKINQQTAKRMRSDELYDKGFTTGSGYCTNFLDYNSG